MQPQDVHIHLNVQKNANYYCSGNSNKSNLIGLAKNEIAILHDTPLGKS